MSVGETYAIAVTGPDDGVAVAARLAAQSLAVLRWAAVWSTMPFRSELTAHFASRSSPSSVAELAQLAMVCVPSPTMDDVRFLIDHTSAEPLCVHWSPRLYTADEGPDAPWVSFVDARGHTRDDAKVYRFELARNAVPLTTLVDRSWDADLGFGPTPGEGWALRLAVVRDHMPEDDLRRWLATATSVPLGAVCKVTR